jgi:hypothetical protein
MRNSDRPSRRRFQAGAEESVLGFEHFAVPMRLTL